MNIYYFDRAGNYTESGAFNPRDPIPRNSTFDAPLDGEGYNVWRNKKWVLESEPASPPPPPPEPMPTSISRRQGKQQLIIDDLDEAVETAIANVTDTKQRKLLQTWYDDADPWERDNPYLQQLGSELGLTDEQTDTMFKAASKL